MKSTFHAPRKVSLSAPDSKPGSDLGVEDVGVWSLRSTRLADRDLCCSRCHGEFDHLYSLRS